VKIRENEIGKTIIEENEIGKTIIEEAKGTCYTGRNPDEIERQHHLTG